MPDKVFLLGLGAQKCGTTWLFDQINRRDDVDMGFAKEYHIFDAATLEQHRWFRNSVTRKVGTLLAGPQQGWQGEAALIRLAMMSDFNLYFDYFAARLIADPVRLTGDITPNYAGLSAETLSLIKTSFAARKVAVKPVFLMRDPVERLQSAVRMRFRMKDITPTLDEELAAMDEMQGQPRDRARSTYETTIRTIDTVFGDNVFYGFYEELFEEATIRQLFAYLGLPYIAPDFDHTINVSRTENALPAERRQHYAQGYAATYRFAASYFGKDRIARLWPSAPGLI